MAFGRLLNALRTGGAEPLGVVDAAPAPVGETEDEQTARHLDELRDSVRSVGRDLPTLLTSQLRQIDDQLRLVVATIADQGASTEQRVLLAAMVSDYIPSPLRSFLALPAADRTDDSRSTIVFARQLELIEETIRDLLNQIRIGAIAELSTHGRFLSDKFQEPDAGLVLGAH